MGRWALDHLRSLSKLRCLGGLDETVYKAILTQLREVFAE
jgi:hypothetical protein